MDLLCFIVTLYITHLNRSGSLRANPTGHAQILLVCHKDKTSGHMGTKRTLARITERFIWPGVAKEVYQMVSVTNHFSVFISNSNYSLNIAFSSNQLARISLIIAVQVVVTEAAILIIIHCNTFFFFELN